MASLWEERELRKRSRDEGEEEITAGERGLLMELASEVGGGRGREDRLKTLAAGHAFQPKCARLYESILKTVFFW